MQKMLTGDVLLLRIFKNYKIKDPIKQPLTEPPDVLVGLDPKARLKIFSKEHLAIWHLIIIITLCNYPCYNAW